MFEGTRLSLKRSIVQGDKYKLYLLSCAVYTKKNEFVKYLREETIKYIIANRMILYENRRHHNALTLDNIVEDELMIIDNELNNALNDIPESD